MHTLDTLQKCCLIKSLRLQIKGNIVFWKSLTSFTSAHCNMFSIRYSISELSSVYTCYNIIQLIQKVTITPCPYHLS